MAPGRPYDANFGRSQLDLTMPIDRVRFTARDAPGGARSGLIVEGQAAPNAEVRVENLSAAPWGPSGEESTFTSTEADAQGRFRVAVAAGQEGDWVRVRAEGVREHSALTVRIRGAAPRDGRRAEVSQQSLRLVDEGPGSGGDRRYTLRNVSQNPRFGEPHLDIKVVNGRTRQAVSFQLDGEGHLPPGARLLGRPGDTFAIHASDGQHEAAGDSVGKLTVPCPGGEPLFAAPGVATVTLAGPLFKDGISPDDPLQGGHIGDCYLVAGASAIAELRPDDLASLMHELPDGRVRFTFQAWDEKRGRYLPEEVVVTREVPSRYGRPCMGMGRGPGGGPEGPATAEAWWPLLEKAYAQWKGSFEAMGSGYPYEVFEALLGREGRHFDTEVLDEHALLREVRRALDERAPMVAWTHPDSSVRPFLGKGLVADHAYSVHGVKEESGRVFVELRNPWGHREPGSDGKDDGIFWLNAEEFLAYFCGLGIAHAA